MSNQQVYKALAKRARPYSRQTGDIFVLILVPVLLLSTGAIVVSQLMGEHFPRRPVCSVAFPAIAQAPTASLAADAFSSAGSEQAECAQEALVQHGTEALPLILPELDGPDSNRRRTALYVLSGLGPKAVAAIPKVIAIAQDQANSSDDQPIRTLGAIGYQNADAVNYLISLLPPPQQPMHFNYVSMSALETLDHAPSLPLSVAPALFAELNAMVRAGDHTDRSSGDDHERRLLANALAKTGSPLAVAPLIALLNQDGPNPNGIYEPSENPLLRLSDTAVPALIDNLRTRPKMDQRVATVQLLVLEENPQARAAVTEFNREQLPTIIQQAEHPAAPSPAEADQTRRQAEAWLGELFDHDRMVRDYVIAAITSPNSSERVWACTRIQELNDWDAAEALELAAKGSDPKLRSCRMALKWLTAGLDRKAVAAKKAEWQRTHELQPWVKAHYR